MSFERSEVRTIDGDLLRALPLENVIFRDDVIRGFQLRVRHSLRRGLTATYRVELGRHRIEPLGRVGVVKLTDAREAARNRLAGVSLGLNDPGPKASPPTLRQFLTDHYAPWVTTARKTGQETVDRLTATFNELLDTPLPDLTIFRLEQWRTKRLKARHRPQPATINRDLAALTSALRSAVEWKFVKVHPLRGLKPSRVDRRSVIRFLTPDEERRLRAALAERDETRHRGRLTANVWRRERGYRPLPEYGRFTDHVTPLILLALNTGCRRGELFTLRWKDADLARALLTVRGATAKSGQSRLIPLNTEAVETLVAWQPGDARPVDLIFPGASTETPLEDIKSAWRTLMKAAKIPAFRFHDVRHTFASKLVMRGVDLNAVRELLGHADLSTTGRYAHAAPEHKAAAVAKLISA